MGSRIRIRGWKRFHGAEQVQQKYPVVCRSLTFLNGQDDVFAVRQFLVQACIEGVAMSMPPGKHWPYNHYAARLLQSAAQYGDAYH
ncbi:hypothetical protein TNCV_3907491 [Trichonephila clavipes]|nr:hypothetical protein TNCV_3907491 [Trichonephila clavipes]